MNCKLTPEYTERLSNLSLEIVNLKENISNILCSDSYISAKKASDILKLNPYFLDTETTGLGFYSQIIEIGIIDIDENIILESRYNPTVDIDCGAEHVHGISKKYLVNERLFSFHAEKIKNILLNNHIVIFNSDFDLDMIESTLRAFDINNKYVDDVDVTCAMYLSADFFGATNRYGTISLSNAIYKAGLNDKDFGLAHSAIGDCRSTLAVFKIIANHKKKFDDEILKIEEKIYFVENIIKNEGFQ